MSNKQNGLVVKEFERIIDQQKKAEIFNDNIDEIGEYILLKEEELENVYAVLGQLLIMKKDRKLDALHARLDELIVQTNI